MATSARYISEKITKQIRSMVVHATLTFSFYPKIKCLLNYNENYSLDIGRFLVERFYEESLISAK